MDTGPSQIVSARRMLHSLEASYVAGSMTMREKRETASRKDGRIAASNRALASSNDVLYDTLCYPWQRSTSCPHGADMTSTYIQS
eukprot:52266-Eustigmatos_ZCMA.PRE.1